MLSVMVKKITDINFIFHVKVPSVPPKIPFFASFVGSYIKVTVTGR